MITLSKIKDFMSGPCLCLPFVGGTFFPKGDLKGERACLSSCLLPIVVVLGANNTLVAFCLTTTKGIILDII